METMEETKATTVTPTIRYGILGCASIGRKNIRAIKLSMNSKLIAIASRDVNKANKYKIDNKLDADVIIYDSYDDLLDSKLVDAVYIPLPTSLHVEWATKAANKKKHILLEKPAAINSHELLLILSECNKNNVVYMDGVMFMHNVRLKLLCKQLNDIASYGNLINIQSSFTFNGSNDDAFINGNIRVNENLDKLGCLGDLSWYSIRFTVVALLQDSKDLHSVKKLFPINVICKCNRYATKERSNVISSVPIDIDGKVTLHSPHHDKEVRLLFDSSFLLPFEQSVTMKIASNTAGVGDKVIHINDFVIPNTPSSSTFDIVTYPASGPFTDFDCRVVSAKETIQSMRCGMNNVNHTHDQEVRMFTKFSKMIKHANKSITADSITNANADIDTANVEDIEYHQMISLLTQQITDMCYESLCKGGECVVADEFIWK